MINTEGIYIYKLSLLAAVACNLNCEYCLVSKNSKDYNIVDFKNSTNKALEDGTYLDNILKSLDRLKQEPNNINTIEIWGQEPTLMLSHLTPHFEDWYEAFPNLNILGFSTNGIDENLPETIYNLVEKIEKTVDQNFTLNVQISYDGIGESKVRGGKNDTVKNNLIKLHKMLNNLKLEHCKVSFFIHAVFSNSIIKYCNSFEKIREFFTDFDNFFKDVVKANINKNVQQGGLTLQYQNGDYSSIEDGLRLAETAERMERFLRVHQKEFYFYNKFPSDIDFGANILGVVAHRFPKRIRNADCKNLDEYANKFINESQQTFHEKITEYCGSIGHDLKILYDGTMATCQNFMFDAYNYNNDGKPVYGKDIASQARRFATQQGVHILNLLTASDEEINKALNWFRQTFTKNNIKFMLNNICNIMFMMAQCGQISHTYIDDLSKIKRHALLLAPIDCCYYNLFTETGSVYVHSISQIRYLCNGLMDKAENFINQVVQREGDIPDGFL